MRPGISEAVVAELMGEIPILGVCLGHQAIGEVFGGKIAPAKRPLYGRASRVVHDGTGFSRACRSRWWSGAITR